MYFVQKVIYENDGDRFILRLYLEKKSENFIFGREKATLMMERESPAPGQRHQEGLGQWPLEIKDDLQVFLNMPPIKFKEALSPTTRGDYPFLCKEVFLGMESLLIQEGRKFSSLRPREEYLKEWPRASFDGIESLSESIKTLEIEKVKRRYECCTPRTSATNFVCYSLEDMKKMMENKGSGLVAISEVHLHKDVGLLEVVMDIRVRHTVYLKPENKNGEYHVDVGSCGSYYGLKDNTYDPLDNRDVKVASEFNLQNHSKTGEK